MDTNDFNGDGLMGVNRLLFEDARSAPFEDRHRAVCISTGSLLHFFVDGIYLTTICDAIFDHGALEAAKREVRAAYKRLAARIMEQRRAAAG